MAATRDWLSGVYEISKVIGATLDLDQILSVIARETRRLVAFDRLSVGLLDPSGLQVRLYVPAADPDARCLHGAAVALQGSLLEQVIRSRQPLTIPDLRVAPRFPDERSLAAEGIVSVALLPLTAGDRTLGTLSFARTDFRPFAEAEIDILCHIADQVAIAVDHAALYAAEKKRANHLAIINQVARRVLSIFDLDTLLQQTASLIQQQFAYYDVSIFIVDRPANEIVLRAQAGGYSAASVVGYRQPIGVGMVGYAAQSGRTLLANDVKRDPHYIVAFEGERESASELVVPVRRGGEVAGVLNVESTQLGAFDAIDVTALETLADQVAQAIDNARLVEEMRALITERLRAQDALERERQKLDDVVSAMGAGLALIDHDLTIAWSNKTLDTWFGLGRSLVGKPCHTVHRPPQTPLGLAQAVPREAEDRACPNCKVLATFLSGEVTSDLQTRITSHLGTRHFEHIFAPIRDAAGHVHQVLLLTLDVTEHTRNIEQIALLQKLGHAMQGVIELDPLLHYILTCVTAGPGLGFNRATLLLTNAEGTMLEGRLGVGPASADEAARIWGELAARGQTLEEMLAFLDEPHKPSSDNAMEYLARQIRIPLSDVQAVPIRALREQRMIVVADADTHPGVSESLRSLLGAKQFVCVPLIAREVAVGALIADNVFTGHPITERDVQMLQTFAGHAGLAISAATAYRRLEEKVSELEETRDRLVRSERLAVVGRLAAHVAHEIRNPLATIGGFTRSMLKAPDDVPKVERNARIILEEVERLEQILANVMNFSKPGSPVLRDRSINEAIDAICAFHENVFAERHITLRKRLDPNCPHLRLDPDQIRQVLLNLCQNAMDSMPNGGELAFSTRALEHHVEIVVADTGHGMTDSVVESIFQPFFTTKVGGTGLGLAVCQKIIHGHGGDILVQSKPGAGSSFTIILPIPGGRPA